MTQKIKLRFKIAKLIRDNYPEINRAVGIEIPVRVMEKEEYIHQLKEKLLEEAEEVGGAALIDEIKDELADVFEVMLALANAYGITLEDIMQTADDKRSAKGAFNRKLYLDYIEMDHDHPNITYFKARPDKYPEVDDISDI